MNRTVYQVPPHIVVEHFEQGALVLSLPDRQLTELNVTARDVLGYTDGVRTVLEVAGLIAADYHIPGDLAVQDTLQFYDFLSRRKIVQKIHTIPRKEGKEMSNDSAAKIYLCNPDVVLREEDEDGGLLFNPDSNQVKVINTTGLFLWKEFQTPKDLEAAAAALGRAFEDAPPSELEPDVQAFLDDMLHSGFIGITEQP